jgi:hypothetical protein
MENVDRFGLIDPVGRGWSSCAHAGPAGRGGSREASSQSELSGGQSGNAARGGEPDEAWEASAFRPGEEQRGEARFALVEGIDPPGIDEDRALRHEESGFACGELGPGR